MAVAHYKGVVKLAWNNQIPTNFWDTECVLLLCNHCLKRVVSAGVLHFEDGRVVQEDRVRNKWIKGNIFIKIQ